MSIVTILLKDPYTLFGGSWVVISRAIILSV